MLLEPDLASIGPLKICRALRFGSSGGFGASGVYSESLHFCRSRRLGTAVSIDPWSSAHIAALSWYVYGIPLGVDRISTPDLWIPPCKTIIWDFRQIRVPYFGGSYNKDPTI